jgi:hypothetical protein
MDQRQHRRGQLTAEFELAAEAQVHGRERVGSPDPVDGSGLPSSRLRPQQELLIWPAEISRKQRQNMVINMMI